MKKNIIFLMIAVIFGVLSRTIFHIAPNLEFVTAITLVGAYFIKNRKSKLILPLFIMSISDIILGNTNIMWFTWSGFMLLPVIQFLLKKISKTDTSFRSGLFLTTSSGIVGTILFYLWTNFGVVVLTNMYSHNFAGLMSSYINAIPFLRIQLQGNLIIVPMVYAISYIVINFKNIVIKNNKLSFHNN